LPVVGALPSLPSLPSTDSLPSLPSLPSADQSAAHSLQAAVQLDLPNSSTATDALPGAGDVFSTSDLLAGLI
jgi:hypothetical protein